MNNANQEVDILSLYLSEIGPIPILTKQQEEALVIRLRDGDDAAKEELIRSNLKLVVHIAKQYNDKNNLELYDLIQEGNVGLVEAANDFKHKIGYSFKSYADDCIRHQIIDAIRTKPKLQTISLFRGPLNYSRTEGNYDTNADFTMTLDEVVPDTKAIDPVLAAEQKETASELEAVIQTLDKTEAMHKLAIGYNPHEFDEYLRKEYNNSLRVLAHPSRSRKAKETEV